MILVCQSVTYSWSHLNRVIRVAHRREDHLKFVWCKSQISRYVLICIKALLRQSKVLLHAFRVGVGIAVFFLLRLSLAAVERAPAVRFECPIEPFLRSRNIAVGGMITANVLALLLNKDVGLAITSRVAFALSFA